MNLTLVNKNCYIDEDTQKIVVPPMKMILELEGEEAHNAMEIVLALMKLFGKQA